MTHSEVGWSGFDLKRDVSRVAEEEFGQTSNFSSLIMISHFFIDIKAFLGRPEPPLCSMGTVWFYINIVGRRLSGNVPFSLRGW